MSVLIDREQMCVRYKSPREQVLWNMMAVEFTHTSVVSMQENMPGAYERFTDYELKLLYLNLCGQKYTGYARDILVKSVMDLVKSLPDSELNGFELATQAAHATDEDYFYRYVKGATLPEKRTEPFVPAALTAVAGYTPAPAPPVTANVAHSAHTQAAGVPAPPSTVQVSAEAPKAGSKTGRVWEIAENSWRQMIEEAERWGHRLDIKELRKSIISLCEAEGINSSTASVQYGKWKITKNL